MSSENEESYRITFKGWLLLNLGDKEGNRIYDALELYIRRNGKGIAIENGTLDFVMMEQVPEVQP